MKKEDLIGKWEIERTVHTFQKKGLAKMEGIGIFEYLDRKELIYREKLMNHTQDSSACVARKAYRYRFLNESIYIYFHKEEKERLFMALQGAKGNLEGSAWCGLDHYHLSWQWISNRSFQMQYQVKGAKKAYSIKSRFKKCR